MYPAKNLVEMYSPQLGEITWHQFTADPRVHSQSVDRFNEINEIIQANNIVPNKIFELCPNDRYTAHLLSDRYGCEAYLLDISKRAMEAGVESAKSLGLKTNFVGVATDFHKIPFEDESFEFVYVHQSLHHTDFPNLVIKELLRVLKKGGILLIKDEPVRRGNCLHLFPSNRFESLSAYERFLFDHGLLAYLAHPTGGARPESIFGMIENQKISLSTYTEVISEFCEIDKVKYNPDDNEWTHATKLDKNIWEMFKAPTTISQKLISSRLRDAFEEARDYYSMDSELMGLRCPEDHEIEDLAARIIKNFSKILPLTNYNERKKAIFEAFGGEVSILATKNKSENISNRDGIASISPKYIPNQIVYKKLVYKNNFIDMENPCLPNLQDSDMEMLSSMFHQDDWSIVMDPGEIRSVVNLNSSPQIFFPLMHKSSVLLLRYYAVAGTSPYRVAFYIDDKEIATDWICMSESRFLKHICMESPRTLSIQMFDLRGAVIDLHENMRVGFLQIFQFSKIES